MNIERIKSSTSITENGCWEWQKSCNSAGYGQLTENKKYWLTHRYAFSCCNDLQDQDVLRHKCHNTKCCNPDHLETGTHKDNYNDSKDVHKKAAYAMRKVWTVDGISYGTSREVVEKQAYL